MFAIRGKVHSGGGGDLASFALPHQCDARQTRAAGFRTYGARVCASEEGRLAGGEESFDDFVGGFG